MLFHLGPPNGIRHPTPHQQHAPKQPLEAPRAPLLDPYWLSGAWLQRIDLEAGRLLHGASLAKRSAMHPKSPLSKARRRMPSLGCSLLLVTSPHVVDAESPASSMDGCVRICFLRLERLMSLSMPQQNTKTKEFLDVPGFLAAASLKRNPVNPALTQMLTERQLVMSLVWLEAAPHLAPGASSASQVRMLRNGYP